MKRQAAAGKGLRSFLENLVLLAAAAVLFAASFPNLLFTDGLPLLAWVAYVPVFLIVRRSGFGAAVFWGALYGYAAYGLFNYWLSVFHPLAGLIVGSIYLVYLALLFPFLRLAVTVFPRRGYLVQWLLWMAFEYLRTQGFLGYSYGISGYSQWNLLPVIQIADITGVWGVSALVVFPSAWLAAALHECGFLRGTGGGAVVQGGAGKHDAPGGEAGGAARGVSRLAGGRFSSAAGAFAAFFRREWIPACVWCVLLAASLVYGVVSPSNYAAPDAESGAGGEDAPRTVKVALIQHNTDPWKPSHAPTAARALEEYRTDFRILSRLSDEALAAHSDTDLVVWSETAFVPRIYWHTTYRDDPASWELVKELLDYLSQKDVPFVIGNDDARKDPALNPDPYEGNRVDYNAVMLFEKGELKTLYRKLHLVPFTEHFPYERQLPLIHRALENADTHFWEKGNEATVFESRGVKFSTPICFEDTFGYLSRDFVLNGAEVIINLSNDAWSKSLPAQMQHLSMAVFRAVENRRSMARSTASGQTCAIDPSGRITAMAEPFTESYLCAELPALTELTFYTRHGDYLGRAFTLAAFLVLIAGAVSYILTLQKRRRLTP